MLQFITAQFFVTDILFETWGLEHLWLDWDTRKNRQFVQAIGLSLGVVLGWVALRMSLNRTRDAESKLRQSALAFAALMEEHFADWQLTTAERDVALFLVKGFSTSDIAELRGTSEGTVKAQTNAIYRKAKVTGRPQLLSLFIEDLMDDTLLPNARTHR